MSAEQNKEVVIRFTEEVINQKKLELVDDYVALNYTLNDAPEGFKPGIEGFREFLIITSAALPDWHATLTNMVTEDDRVIYHYSGRGTHQGEMLGSLPTGKEVTLEATITSRVQGSKIVEEWLDGDWDGFMQQLGVEVLGSGEN